jgi:hypothetical protein
MESPQMLLNEMTLGERMVLAARLAVARHWFNAECERRETTMTDTEIGGADRAVRIMDDPE